MDISLIEWQREAWKETEKKSNSQGGSAASSWTEYGRVGWRMEMVRQRLSFPWQTEWGESRKS